MSKQKVVTWQSPNGGKISVCKPCEERLTKALAWPKDEFGVQFCQVFHGLHLGECDICNREPQWKGEHPPKHCSVCGKDDVKICCSHADYDDGSHDDPVCGDCCNCGRPKNLEHKRRMNQP